MTKAKCVNCNCPADRFINGAWVCNKCYPHDEWLNPFNKQNRDIRRKQFLKEKTP